MIGPGIANVQLTIVSRPPEMPAVNLFAVQVGAFQERERAERVRSEFEQQYGSARLVFRAGNPAVWRVLVGREESSDAAARLAGQIRGPHQPALVVRLDETPEPAATQD